MPDRISPRPKVKPAIKPSMGRMTGSLKYVTDQGGRHDGGGDKHAHRDQRPG